jgi:hypothetical protein
MTLVAAPAALVQEHQTETAGIAAARRTAAVGSAVVLQIATALLMSRIEGSKFPQRAMGPKALLRLDRTDSSRKIRWVATLRRVYNKMKPQNASNLQRKLVSERRLPREEKNCCYR